MRRTLTMALLLASLGCSAPDVADSGDDPDPGAALLITRPDGHNDTAWDTDLGHLRVEAGCILFKGQIAVFPFGTTLVDGSTAVQISNDDEPIALDGSAEVHVIGSRVPLLEEGDWDHAMDTTNLNRWSKCRRRTDASEYADWWQIGHLDLVN